MTKAMTPTTKIVEIGEEAFTLKFNFGAARLAEKEMGMPITRAFAANAAGLETISVVWWAALQANHSMTRAASDELIDHAGLEQAAQWALELIGEYFGVGETAAAGEPGKAKKPEPTSR